MHYRRFTPSYTWAFLSKQPVYRLILYAAIVLLGLWVLLHSIGLSSSGLDLSSSWPHIGKPRYPVHYSPIVDVPDHVWENRAEQVKYAFLHAYGAYDEYAAPYDEVLPVSGGKINNFNGWGVTAFDSLDTMLIMGLEDEYQKGLGVVRQANFSMAQSQDGCAPFFETIIRYLGGLLSAYALSPEDTILLQRAIELVNKLDPVFNSTSGLAYYSVNPTTATHRGTQNAILAEVASLQLEYTYLSKLTGRKEHFNRANTVMKVLSRANLSDTGGMLPIRWDLDAASPADMHLSVGAQADSAHEYLLKLYLLTARSDRTSLEMYIRTTTHIITNLLYLSPTRHLLYVTDTTSSTFDRPGVPTHLFEHLSCFLPGLLALGAHTLPLDNLAELGIDLPELGPETTFGHAGRAYKLLSSYNLKDLHLWAAEGLAQTCWLTYADQPTGLGPDEVVMNSITKEPQTKIWAGDRYWLATDDYLWIDAVDKWKKSGSRGEVPGLKEKHPVIYSERQRLSGKSRGRDYAVRKSGYLLRPETVESFFLLWKITGDWKWRARGWAIFEAIQKETKTAAGYASLRSVERSPGRKEDSMPSYFLAETLKYLYLMFKEEELIPLDQWVFNTEAHPLPVFNWTKEEREKFGI
ncbi:glycoside hydrolase family 47 protein [Macrolepiota fuliginosa MF-IS2]|uniref:alpha-1,2-Mannosidase n=1 Tax=Macrolepiota fuliginosa MF-IS2 TaxID=1400762 RepID=A0A9P5X7B0_9AGAR|nr:glycoside hydrolase family 47 protein [Macrolepiota fuliginosa MF-IS2]